MARKRKSSNGWLGLLVLIGAIAYAPLIAIVGAVIIFCWFVYRITSLVRQSQIQSTRPFAPAIPEVDSRLVRESLMVGKQLLKGGKWQIQLGRVESARRVLRQLSKLPETSEATSLTQNLNHAVNVAVASVTQMLKARYAEQIPKMKAASSARAAKIAESNLSEIRVVCSKNPELDVLNREFGNVFEQYLKEVLHGDDLKARLSRAQALEREGKKRASLDEYLDLLYVVHTDDVADDDQTELIEKVEASVRALVYNCYTRSKKRTARSYLRNASKGEFNA